MEAASRTRPTARIKRAAAWFDPWAPPLILMAWVFFLSAQPDLSSGLGTIDLVGRKFVHAATYALLAFLWWRVLRGKASTKAALALSFALAVAYAISDEYHQSFVDGRHGSPVDVLIDTAGAVLAVAAIRRRR